VESFEYLGSLGFFDCVEKLPEPFGPRCTHLFCRLTTWCGEVHEANSLVVAVWIGSPLRPALSAELVDEPADTAGFESEPISELGLTERTVRCQLTDRVRCGDRHRLPARCRISAKDAEGVDETHEFLTQSIARCSWHSCNIHLYACNLQLSCPPLAPVLYDVSWPNKLAGNNSLLLHGLWSSNTTENHQGLHSQQYTAETFAATMPPTLEIVECTPYQEMTADDSIRVVLRPSPKPRDA